MSIFPNYFTFSSGDISKTEIQLVSLLDSRTSIKVTTALNNPGVQSPSIMAFAGARYSRSADSIEDIYSEIKDAGGNAQQKLANIFRKYGHASVADMSQLFVYIENIPQVMEAKFFNETSLGGGQGRSTRYQDFGHMIIEDISTQLHPENQSAAEADEDYQELNGMFRGLQEYSLKQYKDWKMRLKDEYSNYFQIDVSQAQQRSALTARVFDSSRAFLLSGLGNRTSLAWVTSAREWSRLISVFKADDSYLLRCLGEQLEELLAPTAQEAEKIGYMPEAPDLIRYTSADEGFRRCLDELYEYTEVHFKHEFAQQEALRHNNMRVDLYVDLLPETVSANIKVLVNLFLSLYPQLDPHWLVKKLESLSDQHIQAISAIVFTGFDHHQQMPQSYRVNVWTYRLTYSFAEARDLNRHRAWGRTLPLLDMRQNHRQIIRHGYSLPLYLNEIADFADLKTKFIRDLECYYEQLEYLLDALESKTWFEPELIKQMLPFAHTAEMYMHASPKELSYMTMLRARPGGHINYRQIAYDIARVSKESTQWLAGLQIPTKPDVASRAEFIDRS